MNEFSREVELLEAEIYAEMDRLEVQYKRNLASIEALSEPQPLKPEVKNVRVVRLTWLRLIGPILLVLMFFGGVGVGEAKAADWPCTGDGMSKSCTNCIVLTPAGSGKCQADAVMRGMMEDSPAEKRAALLRAKGVELCCFVEHSDGMWPVTQEQYDTNRGLAVAQAEEPAPLAEVEAESRPSPYDPNTQIEQAASTVDLDLDYKGGMDNRTKIGWLVAGLIACLVLARKFAPAKLDIVMASGKNASVKAAPHAATMKAGLRRTLPFFYWMLDFQTGAGFVAKVLIGGIAMLFAFTAAWGALGPFLGTLAIGSAIWAAGKLVEQKAAPLADVDTGRWTDPAQFTKALTGAGIVPAPRRGMPQPVARLAGQPTSDRYGATARFDLPGALVLSDVLKKQGALAKALRIPLDRLEVTQADSDPEGTLTFWVGQARSGETVAARVPGDRHSADADFVLGRGLKGEPIALRTKNRQTLIAGQPGSGKTSLARRMILHWLADPNAKVFVFDGKSNVDYVDGQAQYSAYVTQFGKGDYVVETEALLTEVNRIVNERNETRTSDKGGVLVVLDEFQEVLADADKATRARLEKLMASATKRGRMANVHIVLATQEVRADTIPTKVRAMFQQILGFRVGRVTEEPIIFGQAVTTKRPKADGELVIMSQAGEFWVKTDYLDDSEWVTAVQGMTPRDQVVLSQVTPLPGLVIMTLDALEEQDDLEPQALFDLLPEEVRTGTPATMAKALGRYNIKSEQVGGRRVYRLAAVQAAVQED